MLVTLSNPLHMAIIGNPPKGHRMARRRRYRHASNLKKAWRKVTRKGAKYSWLRARVAKTKHFKKKHVKGRRWTGKKGTVQLVIRRGKRRGKVWATNPLRHLKRWANPMNIAASAKDTIVTPVTSLPKSLPALLKGSMVKNVGFAAGGAIVALVGGNMLSGVAMPLIAKIPGVSGVMAGGIAQRVVGASFALIAGGVTAKLALKDAASRNAFVTGTAAAALIEAIFPGRIAGLMVNVPMVGPMLAPKATPVQGLAGMFGTNDLAAYVESPAYQGVGTYVESPAYQGVGAYVQSAAYQGVAGPQDAVAGVGYAGEQLAGNLDGIGSNMASHLDA